MTNRVKFLSALDPVAINFAIDIKLNLSLKKILSDYPVAKIGLATIITNRVKMFDKIQSRIGTQAHILDLIS